MKRVIFIWHLNVLLKFRVFFQNFLNGLRMLRIIKNRVTVANAMKL